MQIELITAYYREEFLLPLFMLHYSWVDKVTLVTQQRSDGRFDDEDKVRWINDAVSQSRADWVVLVDMDEFIYPVPYGAQPRVALEQEDPDAIIYSCMTRMWRHKTDQDIDRSLPPVPQRLHGIPDHIKPVIFRPNGCTVGVGNHDLQCNRAHHDGKPWAGAHWANADACFWIERETRDRGPRLSDLNVQRGYGTHTRRTREQILEECRLHENDPVIISLT